jgi:hypothetical protein
MLHVGVCPTVQPYIPPQVCLGCYYRGPSCASSQSSCLAVPDLFSLLLVIAPFHRVRRDQEGKPQRPSLTSTCLTRVTALSRYSSQVRACNLHTQSHQSSPLSNAVNDARSAHRTLALGPEFTELPRSQDHFLDVPTTTSSRRPSSISLLESYLLRLAFWPISVALGRFHLWSENSRSRILTPRINTILKSRPSLRSSANSPI